MNLSNGTALYINGSRYVWDRSVAGWVPGWKAGDRFRGSGSGRTGLVLWITPERVSFQMDDESVTSECDRYLFEKHARPLQAGVSYVQLDLPAAEETCVTCSRMNDVGVKTCWHCGGAPATHG